MSLKAALRNELLQCDELSQLKQSEIAELCDISIEYYKQMIAGKANPSLKVLAEFRFHFQIDVNKIIDEYLNERKSDKCQLKNRNN